MQHKRFNKKFILIVIVLIIAITIVLSILLFKSKDSSTTKPNPSPGSGKQATQESKSTQQQKQQATSQKLSKLLAEAPKDPKTQCIVIAKFQVEQIRDDQIEQENKRNEDYIKRFGDNKSNQHIHQQNIERTQRSYQQSSTKNNCR